MYSKSQYEIRNVISMYSLSLNLMLLLRLLDFEWPVCSDVCAFNSTPCCTERYYGMFCSVGMDRERNRLRYGLVAGNWCTMLARPPLDVVVWLSDLGMFCTRTLDAAPRSNYTVICYGSLVVGVHVERVECRFQFGGVDRLIVVWSHWCCDVVNGFGLDGSRLVFLRCFFH